MKALEWLRAMRRDTHGEELEIDEAIAELVALQQHKSCEGCKYFNKSINGGLCFRLDITVSTTFYCQGYEAKEQ